MSPDTLAATKGRSGSGPSSDIARLKGARFISAIETDEGQRLNESLIKQLTSREPITARFLNQEDFEFAPTWKLWLATNHKPTIRGTDRGIWRRIKLIPFTVILEDDEKDK
jgi:putative DNA primase/helicase